MVFYPDGRENGAKLVSSTDGKSPVINSDYKSELEAYLRDKEINLIMRQRHGVRM
jgi:hypothetical protein